VGVWARKTWTDDWRRNDGCWQVGITSLGHRDHLIAAIQELRVPAKEAVAKEAVAKTDEPNAATSSATLAGATEKVKDVVSADQLGASKQPKQSGANAVEAQKGSQLPGAKVASLKFFGNTLEVASNLCR
jgi:hypothetical protein